MNKQILTPYTLFFADDTNTLSALLKDNRLRRVKKLDSFSGLSFDRKTATGISFNGEKTALTQTSLEFDEKPNRPFGEFFGYFYYPAINRNAKKLAMIQIDLLHAEHLGSLCLYRFFKGKWRLTEKREAWAAPPFFAADKEVIFFIDDQKRLVCLDEEAEVLLENVRLFTVTSDGLTVAVVTEDKIQVYDLQTGKKKCNLTVSFVTALCFSDDKNTLFFANFVDGRARVYALDITQTRISLLTQHPSEITLMVAA